MYGKHMEMVYLFWRKWTQIEQNILIICSVIFSFLREFFRTAWHRSFKIQAFLGIALNLIYPSVLGEFLEAGLGIFPSKGFPCLWLLILSELRVPQQEFLSSLLQERAKIPTCSCSFSPSPFPKASHIISILSSALLPVLWLGKLRQSRSVDLIASKLAAGRVSNSYSAVPIPNLILFLLIPAWIPNLL